MVNLKSVRPPRVNVNTEKGSFWKQIGMIIIGTTISLAFTLIAAQLTENHQRAKDRRLSAMMVMSNIEIFSRLMDDYSAYLAPADRVATWLLGKPLEELELMSEEKLNSLIDQVTSLPFMSQTNRRRISSPTTSKHGRIWEMSHSSV